MSKDAQHETEKPPKVKNTNRFLKWGLIASVIYVGLMVFYAFWVGSPMSQMIHERPVDFATFLSGVFAPLAFGWLVLGFMQQGEELRNSADALKLQGDELAHSVEQQRQLVQASREQIVAMQEEAERLELAAQPTFSIEIRYITQEDGNRVPKLVFTSLGPLCTGLRVSADNIERRIPGTYLDGFPANGYFSFRLPIPTPDGPEATIVRAEYTDARGNRRAQMFRIPHQPGDTDNPYGEVQRPLRHETIE